MMVGQAMKLRVLAFIGAVCLMIIGHAANAAVVTLENGDRVTGKLQQMTDGMLVLTSDMFGEVKIPWAKVRQLETDTQTRVQLFDGSEVKGQMILDGNSMHVVDADETKVIARTQVAAVNPPIIDPSVKYSGWIDFGGTVNRGNSTDDQLDINGELIARTIKDRYTLAVEVNEDRSGNTSTASSRRLSAQYDLFLKNKNYLLVNAKTASDRFADLNSRSSLGAGYGYQFTDTELVKFSGEVGMSYVFENYETQPSQSFPAMSLGLKYDRKFFDNRLVYFQNIGVDTSLNSANNTLLRNRMGIRVPIAKGLNVSAQFNLDYNNAPPVDKKKSDTTLIFTVGYAY
jgi:putative salt-induced outer membrane protein YdiY